jgi:hypothetical protein
MITPTPEGAKELRLDRYGPEKESGLPTNHVHSCVSQALRSPVLQARYFRLPAKRRDLEGSKAWSFCLHQRCFALVTLQS